MTQVPDPTYGKDLTPKKFILHGHISFAGRITFEANAFQELPTAYTVKNLFDLVVDFFGLQVQAEDIENAFQTYLSNAKLLTVKTRVLYNGEDTGPALIESNGGRYPSCSLNFSIPNPLWNEDVHDHLDTWSIGFEYRKGKWTIRHTEKNGHWNQPHRYPATRQQMLDLVDTIRATRDEV